MTQQTTQRIGKIEFIVVSNFKESGHTAEDKIINLLKREIQEKDLPNAFQARYTKRESCV